jgi:hypothetical protein
VLCCVVLCCVVLCCVVLCCVVLCCVVLCCVELCVAPCRVAVLCCAESLRTFKSHHRCAVAAELKLLWHDGSLPAQDTSSHGIQKMGTPLLSHVQSNLFVPGNICCVQMFGIAHMFKLRCV